MRGSPGARQTRGGLGAVDGGGATTGAVTQIIAGTGISVSPVGGTGAVTVTATGGISGLTTGTLVYASSATAIASMTPTYSSTNGQIYVGETMIQEYLGNNITAATDIAIPKGTNSGNLFTIVGTTVIDHLASSLSGGGTIQAGARISLIVPSGGTVRHGIASSGSNLLIRLANETDFVATQNTILSLRKTTSEWVQDGIPSTATVLWNNIGNPSGNQALSMGTTTTTQTWTAGAKLNYMVSDAVDDTIETVAKLSHHNTTSFSGSGSFGAALDFYLNDEDNATDVQYGRVVVYHPTSESAQNGTMGLRVNFGGVMTEVFTARGGGNTSLVNFILDPGITLKFNGGTSGATTYRASAVSDNTLYDLPATAPTTSGQFLQCTTAGVMSWSSYATANTTTFTTGSVQTHTTSGTAAAGFGTANYQELESAGGTTRQAARTSTVWTTATNAAEVAEYRIAVMSAGTLPAQASDQFKLAPTLLTLFNGAIEIGSTQIDMHSAGMGCRPSSNLGALTIYSRSDSNSGFNFEDGDVVSGIAGGSIALSWSLVSSAVRIGMFGVTRAIQGLVGATLTNNVTAGGTTNVVDNVVAAPVDTNAASLTSTRDAVYQLTLKLATVEAKLKLLGAIGT